MSFVYSDLNSISPTIRPMLVDVQSVYQALFTLFNTRPGENPFNPEFGFELEDELFELIDDLGALAVIARVVQTVKRWEPRALVDNSRTQVIPFPDENRYELDLVFELQGVSGQQFSFTGSFTP